MDPRYLTVRVPVSEADYEKAKASWLCHKSQYTPETIEGMHQLIKTSQKGTAYFQPFAAASPEQASLFHD